MNAAWSLRALDAGGAGDCLFHSVAAGLELMVQSNPLAAQHIFARIPLEDFCKTKAFLVKLLRRFVAESVDALPIEEILSHLISMSTCERLGAWHDAWHPIAILRAAGLSFLLDAATVEAVPRWLRWTTRCRQWTCSSPC